MIVGRLHGGFEDYEKHKMIQLYSKWKKDNAKLYYEQIFFSFEICGFTFIMKNIHL